MNSSCVMAMLLILSAKGAAGPSPADFQSVATITGEGKPEAPAAIALSVEVISQARADLADLRLFDDLDRETPYVIHEQARPEQAPASHAFGIVAYQKTDDAEELLLEWPRDDLTIRELHFTIDGKDFHKRVEVAAGSGAENLHPVTADAIFDFSSRVKLRRTLVRIPPTRAAVVRITLRDANASTSPQSPEMKLRYDGLEFWTAGTAAGPFRVDRIVGVTGEAKAAETEFERVTIREPASRIDKDGNTIVELGVRLPVALLTLDVANPYYHRHVQLLASHDGAEESYRVAGGGVIYKVPGMSDSENELACASLTAHLRLKVLNEDNPPLRIQSVEVAWVRRNLIFVPEAARSYRLFAGNGTVAAPRYELRNLIPADPASRANYPAMSLAALQANSAYRPPVAPVNREPMEKAILTVLVVVLGCALSLWAYRLLKQVPKPTGP